VSQVFIATMLGSWEEEYKDLSAESFRGGLGWGGVLGGGGRSQNPDPSQDEGSGTARVLVVLEAKSGAARKGWPPALWNPLERRDGVATDFIGTEKRIRARRMWNRGESSRTSKPAPFTNRRVRHPQKISFHVGDVERLATRRRSHRLACDPTHPVSAYYPIRCRLSSCDATCSDPSDAEPAHRRCWMIALHL
jgi:hypothetical protein